MRQLGTDFVLDIDAMLARVTEDSVSFGDQHVILLHVTAFDADQLV